MLFLFSLFPTSLQVGAADSHVSPKVSGSRSTVDSWPAFRHDPKHTGQSASTAPNNNQTLWTYITASYWLGGVTSSPTVADGMVYVGSTDRNVYALNASTGTPIWTYTTRDAVESSATVANGRVFIGSDDRRVYALNASTGAYIWSYTTGDYVISSPAFVDGLVFVGSKDGRVYALNETTGSQVWSYTTGAYVDSSPAVSGGVVYVGSDDGNVYALDTITGARVWRFTTGGAVGSSPAVVDGLVFVGSEDGRVYALNETTGSQVWNCTTGAYVDSSPAVSGGVVYVGSDDGNVYALDASTGARLWSYTTGSTIYSSPAVADGKVIIGPSNDTVYALNAFTGTLIWSYATGNYFPASYVFSCPAVADGMVYAGADNGEVYAFGSLVHDVAITDANTSQTLVGLGHDLNVTVTAEDLGDYQETLNVTVYANSTPIASQDDTLSSGDHATLKFTWNTAGFACGDYIITAYAWPVPDETDTSDNTLSFPVRVGIADLAITDLPTLKTVIGQGFSGTMNVTAANQGDYSATSNITVCANETVVATFENITLESGSSTTLTFTWNATIPKGNYTLSAYVEPVPYEIDTMDNNFTSPVTVMIGMPGDVQSPFGVVDMKDIAYVAKRFNADTSSPLWDPNADFDGSGKVDMKDIALVAKSFAKHDP